MAISSENYGNGRVVTIDAVWHTRKLRKWPRCYDWRGMAYTFWRKWPSYDWRGMAYTFWQGKAVRTPSDTSANNIAIVSSYKCRSALSTLFIYVSLRMFARHTLKSSVTGGVPVGGGGGGWGGVFLNGGIELTTNLLRHYSSKLRHIYR